MIGYAGKYRSPCLRAPDGDRATEALAPGLHHPNVGLRRLEERGDGLGDVPQHLFDLERRGDEPVHVVQRLEALGVLLRLAVEAGVLQRNGGLGREAAERLQVALGEARGAFFAAHSDHPESRSWDTR